MNTLEKQDTTTELPINGDVNRVGCAAIILAAGRSTRMKSATPKSLHTICGVPMTTHVVRACRAAGVERIVVVVGHEADAVRKGLGDGIEYAVQASQRGTGDAVLSAQDVLSDWSGTILVMAGDTPLVQPRSLESVRRLQAESDAPLAILTAVLDDATGYGRVLRSGDGTVLQIVEERDATPEQRAIKEWNPSIYVFKAHALWKSLHSIQPNNAQGEFYLTDTVRIIAESGQRVEAAVVENSSDMLGVNTRVELAEAAAVMRGRINRQHMLTGVSITDPATTYIDADVTVGQDTFLHPGTVLNGNTQVGTGCTIGPGAIIRDSIIGAGSVIVSSQIVESILDEGVRVGPYANLRPGTRVGRGVRIGDFVELKNSVLGDAVQINHLSYIGDSEIGSGTNIGAGTITCNFDGFKKHRTVIGKDAFIGSHSTLIAPVTVGDGVLVAAGSTVTSDVPDNALAIARPYMTIKAHWAARYRELKRISDN